SAGLRHVRSSAATLPANGCRRCANQIYGRETLLHVFGDADHNAGLAIFRRADKYDDARTERLLALIRQRLQVLCGDPRHDTAHEAYAGYGFLVIGIRSRSTTTKSQLL